MDVTTDEDGDSGDVTRVDGRARAEHPVWIPGTLALDVILHRSDSVAVWLSNFRVTPDGMRFELQARHSGKVAGQFTRADLRAEPLPSPPLDESAASVEDLDGIWTIDTRASELPDPAKDSVVVGMAFGGESAEIASHCLSPPMLLWIEGSTYIHSGQEHLRLGCSKIPDADVRFWATWPLLGIERVEATVPQSIFAEGASRAQRLWNSPYEDGGPPSDVVVIN